MRTERKESEKIKGFSIEREENREMGKKFIEMCEERGFGLNCFTVSSFGFSDFTVSIEKEKRVWT